MRSTIFFLIIFSSLCISCSRASYAYNSSPVISSEYISTPLTSSQSFYHRATASIQKSFVIPFLKNTIDRIRKNILKNESRRISLLKTLIPILSVLIILFIASSIFIVFYVFIFKTSKKYQEKRKYSIGQRYLKITADYLVNKKQSEYPIFPGLYSSFNRKILIGQIYSLSQNLFGNKQNKLLKLFRIRRLLKHVLFSIAISGKYKKAVYLKLFSVIIPNKYLDNKFEKYLFSRHHELRRFAQLASLNYNPQSLEKILKDYPYSLTLWDQIHFFEVIDRRSTIPPDFSTYLKSSNPTVILFGLRMIRIFYQTNTKEKQLVELLRHTNKNIKYEALKTISDLNVEGVDNIILAYLSEIDEKHKVLVIEYIIKNNLLDDNTLFKFFYSEIKDLDRLNILKTVYNNYPNGDRLINDFKNYTNEEKIKSMCTFILENAI
ncbi:MAG: hypothetical protein R6U04_00680 [Bacteroidales bacterium]